MLARIDGQWQDVANPSDYGCEKDGFNRCEFNSVTTDGLRLEIQLKDRWSTGLHEWRVE